VVADRSEVVQAALSDDVSDVEHRVMAFARQRQDVPPAVYAIGQWLLQLGYHVDRSLNEAAAKLDLLPVELLMLDALQLAEPDHTLTPTQLRSQLHITQGGVTKCIARLEGMGLVQRRPDSNDGRVVLVKMLPKARKLLMRGDLWGCDAVAAFQMAPPRRAQLAELLREMLALADQEAQRRSHEGK
jgi:DNA-binding MarR family transcriptional regulator